MKLKDLLISVGSFIFGCVVTLNLVGTGITEKSNKNINSGESEIFLKSAEGNKLFGTTDYFLIIIITSCADNTEHRTAIRETWGLMSKDSSDVQYFFIIGSEDLSDEKIIKIKNEQIKYNDMFILSVSDTYGALSKKVLLAYAWFEKEFNFKYILKCDDDSFVILPKIIYELKNGLATYNSLYWGYFNGRASIQQHGKWKENGWFLCDRYLPYALGGGYVLSHSLVRYIKENEKLLGAYISEDVSVGVWLAPLNITRFHDVRFNTGYMSRGCSNNFIITHKQTPKSMRELYLTLIETGKLCKFETKTKSSYEYNWNVLPSKCCTAKKLTNKT